MFSFGSSGEFTHMRDAFLQNLGGKIRCLSDDVPIFLQDNRLLCSLASYMIFALADEFDAALTVAETRTSTAGCREQIAGNYLPSCYKGVL